MRAHLLCLLTCLLTAAPAFAGDIESDVSVEGRYIVESDGSIYDTFTGRFVDPGESLDERVGTGLDGSLDERVGTGLDGSLDERVGTGLDGNDD